MDTPIKPSVAREKLDCLTNYREALEIIANTPQNTGLTKSGMIIIAKEALAEKETEAT